MDDKILDEIIRTRTAYVKHEYDLNTLNRAKRIMSKTFSGKYTLSEKEKLIEHVLFSTDVDEIKQHIKKLAEKIDELTVLSKTSLVLLKNLVSKLPNLLSDKVPIHIDEDNNKIERVDGDCITRHPLDQYELCTKFSLISSVPHLCGNRGYMMVNDMV
jgi:seryl-tRNA synthetase